MEYLQVALQASLAGPVTAADVDVDVYEKHKQPSLDTVPGALSKELLVRDEDVQVLRGFETAADAKSYLAGDLFALDVVSTLSPLLEAAPDIRLHDAA